MESLKFLIVPFGMALMAPSALAREIQIDNFEQPALLTEHRGSLPQAVMSAMIEMTNADGWLGHRMIEFEVSPLEQGACTRQVYRPAWWLKPEIEHRRATYFGAMSEIACEIGLPASLLDAVVAQESGYKAWAISEAGAMGMMQVMPGTARHLELWNPWDALANMRAGARYLRQQLDRFGRVDLALAAYNAGPERRSLAQGYVPAIPETRNYVRTITTNWLRLTQLEKRDSDVAARAAAAHIAVRASGYREVSLTTYEGINAENPI